MNDTAAVAAPTRIEAPNRGGRPTSRDIPRTSLDHWMVAQEPPMSSAAMVEACKAAAVRLAVDEATVPSRKAVDDMRAARYYPSLVVAYLIHEATSGAVGVEQWARDVLKYGKRPRKG